MINAVIDLSHHNRISDFSSVKAAGIHAIIHKATQSTRYVDPDYTINRRKALDAGLRVGAYHFGVAGNAEDQAEHFLEKAKENPLLVLDFEGNPQGLDMSLIEAEHFVRHIYDLTGRYPGLYSGHTLKEACINAGITDPKQTELSRCWLWIAHYNTTPVIPAIWPHWTMWQYTDGAAGPEPHTVAGIGRCDRDYFQGTVEELEAFFDNGAF
jgi:lysozyme